MCGLSGLYIDNICSLRQDECHKSSGEKTKINQLQVHVIILSLFDQEGFGQLFLFTGIVLGVHPNLLQWCEQIVDLLEICVCSTPRKIGTSCVIK